MAASENSTAEIRNFPIKGQPGEEHAAPREEARAEAPQPAHEAPKTAPRPAAPANAPAAAPKAKTGGRRRVVVSVIALLALAGAGWYGYNYYATGRFIVSTDDAYVGGDIATISPKVAGYVAQVNVVANQKVKAGDTLVTLDDGDYTIARDQAQATIDTAGVTLKRIDAQIAGSKAAVIQAQAQKTSAVAAQKNAQLAQQRAKSLTAQSVGTQATLDAANAALDKANANVTSADAAITAANANVDVLVGQRAEAVSGVKSDQLALDKANRDLSFAVLKAP
ncbi:MAG: biotin/lipoyl-binding protein, partial [Devosia sp.]